MTWRCIYTDAKKEGILRNRVNVALRRICRWIETHSLNIAEHKTEAIILKGAKEREEIQINIKDTIVRASKHTKYLGLIWTNNKALKYT